MSSKKRTKISKEPTESSTFSFGGSDFGEAPSFGASTGGFSFGGNDGASNFNTSTFAFGGAAGADQSEQNDTAFGGFGNTSFSNFNANEESSDKGWGSGSAGFAFGGASTTTQETTEPAASTFGGFNFSSAAPETAAPSFDAPSNATSGFAFFAQTEPEQEEPASTSASGFGFLSSSEPAASTSAPGAFSFGGEAPVPSAVETLFGASEAPAFAGTAESQLAAPSFPSFGEAEVTSKPPKKQAKKQPQPEIVAQSPPRRAIVATTVQRGDVVETNTIPRRPSEKLNVAFGPTSSSVTTFVQEKNQQKLSGSSSPSQKEVMMIHDWQNQEQDNLKFLNESHSLFIKLQKTRLSVQKKQSAPKGRVTIQDGFENSLQQFQHQIKETSRCYRALIQARVQNQKRKPGVSKALLNSLQFQEKIMHLCEILYLNAEYNSTSLFIQWLQQHYQPNLKANSEAEWRTIMSLVLQGNNAIAVEELEKSSFAEDETFVTILDSLRIMPKLQPREQTADFIVKFNKWQAECGEFLMLIRDDESVNDQLKELAGILAGDDSMLPKSLTWYEYVGYHILFKYPLSTIDQIIQFADEWLGTIKPEDLDTVLSNADKIVFSFMRSDLIDSFSLMAVNNSEWFKAHLSDLLWHSERAQQTFENNSEKVAKFTSFRESCILEYVESISSISHMWKLCLDYLTFCPSRGVAYILDFIERIPIETELKLQKLISFCNSYKQEIKGILETYQETKISSLKKQRAVEVEYSEIQKKIDALVRSMHTLFGVQQIKKYKFYAAGIKHFILAQDNIRISKIMDEILTNYIRACAESQEQIAVARRDLESIAQCVQGSIYAYTPVVEQQQEDSIEGNTQHVSQLRQSFVYNNSIEKIAFIQKYIDLLQALDTKNYTVAAGLILVLLTNKTSPKGNLRGTSAAPRRFWIILFIHALILLQSDNAIYFNSEQTYTLMNCFQELTSSHRKAEYLQFIDESVLQAIRLALSKNLAKSLIISQQQQTQKMWNNKASAIPAPVASFSSSPFSSGYTKLQL